MLVPQAAYAQKKKPKGGNANPPPAAAPAAPAPADADAPAPAAPATGAAGGDQTGATPAPGAAGGDQTGATPPAAGGDQGGMDVCQITPDAPQCAAAKEINFGEEAKKQVHAEVYAVQQQYVLRAQRFEIQPYFNFTLNDQFVSHNGPGLALNYYITQVLAIGVDGVWYGGLNGESDFNFQNRRAARIAVPLNNYQFSADLNFTYVPMYGKFAGFGDFIFNYDVFISGGGGIIRTQPVSVIDPDNRKFTDWNNLVNFDLGIGFRIFFTRWLAAVLEVRDLMFFDRLENTNVSILPPTDPNGPLNPNGQVPWLDPDTHFTNDVQLQLGLSIFLPTSFEYRLPK
ncbi:MAG TPA: outer membrane beta-barrel domain-containing protein [Polyangiaceae bacterium]|nr:outer membrane beta-barrel domain-containing protein [Polyangiaceae bacterium]